MNSFWGAASTGSRTCGAGVTLARGHHPKGPWLAADPAEPDVNGVGNSSDWPLAGAINAVQGGRTDNRPCRRAAGRQVHLGQIRATASLEGVKLWAESKATRRGSRGKLGAEVDRVNQGFTQRQRRLATGRKRGTSGTGTAVLRQPRTALHQRDVPPGLHMGTEMTPR